MSKKTIRTADVQGQRVLIRADFNVPLDASSISDDRRIRGALPTIQHVIERGGRAILMSHLGRPKGEGYEAAHSLEPVARRLGELLGTSVAFPSHDCTDDAAADAVASMGDGDVLLLENLRFHPGEKGGDASFASSLAKLGDVYVNDAFGTCHRSDASMVALPRAMGDKPRVIGFLVERELQYLGEALARPERPLVVVLGGAKVSDKIGVVRRLLELADDVVIGGAMASTFCKALGHRVGSSRIEQDRIADAKAMIDEAARHEVNLHIPFDHVCSTVFSDHAGDIDVYEDDIPDRFMALDIGPKTQSHFADVIRKAKTIVWNGPMGVFEWAPFRIGTKAIARAIADATERGATSIVGGGDSASAVEMFGLAEAMSHVSTGGGASLALLEGGPMPALDAVEDA